MGLFSSCDYKCSECTYLDLSKREYGKYYCEKEYEYVRANELSCSKFCKAYSRDSSEIRRAEEFSHDYESGSGCYITTMLCHILQKEDNNVYLNTLRKFRDEILQKSINGSKILVEYDIVGPKIAALLEQDHARVSIAITLFNNFIIPTTLCIDNNWYDDAVTLYKGMTQKLMEFYHIKYVEPKNIDMIDMTKSGHGRLVYNKK